MLSIAICTYNRAEQLTVLLDQLTSVSDWLYKNAEVIVVDNNSTDKTWALLASYTQKLPLRPQKEVKQGLSNARNRAIEEFKGDALLFLDDDVSVTLNTFLSYRKILEEQPEVDYIGGRITVDWLGEPPRWLSQERMVLLDGLFGNYDHGDSEFLYSGSDSKPFGANFILRRSLIKRVGLFDVRLGVVGDQIARGEETDYFIRAQEIGAKGLYSPTSEVGHRFQKERINIPYLYRYGIEKGRAACLIDGARSDAWLMSSLNFLVRGTYQLLKGRRDRFYQCVINIGIRRGVYTESTGLEEVIDG